MTSTNVSTSSTSIFSTMEKVHNKRLESVKNQIAKAIDGRALFELEKRQGVHSNDFKHVEALGQSDAVARFFLAVGIVPEYYINSVSHTPEVFADKSGLDAICKTGNLKAYKKMRETAEYFAHGTALEKVLKTFVACALVSSQHHLVIPRDVCVRFLNSVPLNRVSDELIEALDHFRAKHMSGGAETQTSQCTLQLATMRAAQVVRNGHYKDFALDVNSVVVESFAQKFNMMEQLEKARAYRATISEKVAA